MHIICNAKFNMLLWCNVTYDFFTYVGGYPYPTLGNAEILPFLMSHRRMERPKNCAYEL